MVGQVSDVYDDAFFAVKNDFVAQKTNDSIVLGDFSYVVFVDFSRLELGLWNCIILGSLLMLLLMRANVAVSHS